MNDPTIGQQAAKIIGQYKDAFLGVAHLTSAEQAAAEAIAECPGVIGAMGAMFARSAVRGSWEIIAADALRDAANDMGGLDGNPDWCAGYEAALTDLHRRATELEGRTDAE